MVRSLITMIITNGSGEFSWEQKRFESVGRLIDERVLDRRTDILDIGCANGGLLNILASRGFRNLYGLDQAAACIREIEARGYSGYRGGITDLLALPERRFGVLILSHVLEHIFDLTLAMRHCIRLLNDDGLVYIETPNAAAYGQFKTVPYYFFDAEHINHFTSRSLANLAGRHGLVVEDLGDKVISAAEGVDYPATWILARKRPGRMPEQLGDDGAKRGILEHLRYSEDSPVHDRLQALADSGRSIIVWGAGSYTQRLLGHSALGRCDIRYLIDSDKNKWGKRLRGIQVRGPSDIDDESLLLVICAAWVGSRIYDQAVNMGLRNPCIVL